MRKIISKIKNRLTSNKNNVELIYNKKLINSFIKNPDFPYLISFPRTGSHWLRMIMELYFEKPSFTCAFYYKKAKEYMCYHAHDMVLDVERKNVIYLYRNPVETVYSHLNYSKQNINNEIFIKYWANIYGLHLEKWLIAENFTKKKTILTYEGMQNNMPDEFSKVCGHFNVAFDKEKLSLALKKISKEKLKTKTGYDQKIVNLSENYVEERKAFADKHSDMIYFCVYNQNEKLKNFF